MIPQGQALVLTPSVPLPYGSPTNRPIETTRAEAHRAGDQLDREADGESGMARPGPAYRLSCAWARMLGGRLLAHAWPEGNGRPIRGAAGIESHLGLLLPAAASLGEDFAVSE